MEVGDFSSQQVGGCKYHSASERKLEGLGYSDKSATFWTSLGATLSIEFGV